MILSPLSPLTPSPGRQLQRNDDAAAYEIRKRQRFVSTAFGFPSDYFLETRCILRVHTACSAWSAGERGRWAADAFHFTRVITANIHLNERVLCTGVASRALPAVVSDDKANQRAIHSGHSFSNARTLAPLCTGQILH